MTKTRAGFEQWATVPNADNKRNASKTSWRKFLEWERTGNLETNVKITLRTTGSRRARVAVPLPFDVDGVLTGDGLAWYADLMTHLKEHAPAFLINKLTADSCDFPVEYDSDSKYVYSMIRHLVHYWMDKKAPETVVEPLPAPPAENEDRDDEVPPANAPLPPVEEDAVMMAPLAVEEEEEEDDYVEPPPPSHLCFGVPGRQLKVPLPELCLGSLILGDTGSGKTFLLKHFLETVVTSVPSLTSIVLFDPKGDLMQLASPWGGCAYFDEHVDVSLYTFGSDHGKRATLDPFTRVAAIEAEGAATREGHYHTAVVCEQLAFEVLAGTVTLDRQKKYRLEGGFEMETRERFNSSYGVRVNDDKAIAKGLVDAVKAVFMRCLRYGVPLPRDYGALLREVEVAKEPRCADGTPADPVQTDLIKNGDIAALCNEIRIRVDANDGLCGLYETARGDETRPTDDDVYPLDARTFFDPACRTKRVKISVVSMGLMGESIAAVMHKQLILSVVLRRVAEQAGLQGGSDHAPRVLVGLDEAAYVMPATAEKTGDTMTSTICIEGMIKRDRDKGVAVVLATQRPLDLHGNVRSIATGVRLIGKFEGSAKDKDAVLKEVLKKEGKVKAKAKAAVAALRPKTFVGVASALTDVVTVRAPSTLKRLHESSSAWVARSHPDHPLARYDAERKRARA